MQRPNYYLLDHPFLVSQALKSITLTTFDEKHAAIRDSSLFHATSNISPFPLKFLICFPSFTLHTYSCPASEPLAR